MIIGEKHLSLEDVWKWVERPTPVSIHPLVKAKMARSRQVVEECLKDKEPHYGINTGFGSLANKRIPEDKLNALQYNLVKSHACGVGEPFSDEVVRLLMLLRANVLAMGFSGVRYDLLEYVVNYINEGKLPKIPSQGSVGASGDLSPLAHLALALVEGGLKLAPKEGLALINGIQATLAVALLALRDAKKLINHANISAALTVEGLRGSGKPFDKRLADVRQNDEHDHVSETIRNLIQDSQIITSHKNCSRVQDPYSLRCVPQVHGAVLSTYKYVEAILKNELSACTDNPLVFTVTSPGEVISGGNFHGTPIGLACDNLAVAITALGNISERRIEQMINPKQGELKVKYLVKDAGINSGFMVAHVTASSLASENKTLSFPASSDSVTTSGGQEDFVSMACWAARKLAWIISNTEKIIAIELLAGVQAIDMQDERLEAGKGTKKVYDVIRKHIPVLESDRVMFEDVEKMLGLMKSGDLLQPMTKSE